MTGELPRRWLTEKAVLEELETLNDVSMDTVHQYRVVAVQAAEAEAAHKKLRAQAILKAKATKSAATARATSVAEAELVAEADDAVSAAYLQRLITAAQADATKESLRTIRNNQDALRTAAASHRDQIAGPGWSGKR